MAELPPEIVTNILSRVDDLKTIGRCRCVCKLWSSFFQLPSGLVLLWKNLWKFSEYQVYYFQHDDSGSSSSSEEPLHPTKHLDASFLARPLRVGNVAFIAGSANGFVSVVTVPQSFGPLGLPENPIYVFNPITEQRIQLPDFNFDDISTELLQSNSITEQQHFQQPRPFNPFATSMTSGVPQNFTNLFPTGFPHNPFASMTTGFPQNLFAERPTGFLQNPFAEIPAGFPQNPFAERPTGSAAHVFTHNSFAGRPTGFTWEFMQNSQVFTHNSFAGRPTGFTQGVFMQNSFPCGPSRSRQNTRWFCGFGYEDSRREYKFVLVRIVSEYNEVQVHTLGSAGWRKKTGIVPACLVCGDGVVSSAFVNGSLHWFTTTAEPTPTIVSFDLGTEEFGFVDAPNLFRKFEDQQLGLMEKDLSIVDWSDNGEIGIWVMKEYNVRESWVKQFSIEKQVLPCTYVPKLIKLCNDGELLMLCDGHNLVGYDTVTRKARSIWTENKAGFRIQVHPVTGSMFSVKGALGID